ncbi:COG4235 Cytochrome c biogenesis factor [Rhabdaerophilaceae bacterium]
MMLWIAILLLTVGAAALSLSPLFRARAPRSTLDHAVAVYQARKGELARQVEAGLITDAERLATEAEQARRLLALEKQGQGVVRPPGEHHPSRANARRKFAALLILMGLPAIALPIYGFVGRPTAPDQPLAKRAVEPQSMQVADALQRIEQHLARNPDDLRAYEVVAPVYLRSGRFEDASFALRRIIALAGESADRLADLGEALMAASNGVVNAEAKAAFNRAIALDGRFAKARFYLALASEQDGDIAGAVARLTELSHELPAGPAQERVETELDRFRVAGSAPPRAAASGPASEAGQALANLPSDDRAKAIEAMVESLSSRLQASGGPVEEWRRLLQSRLVLGQKDKALEALKAARQAFASDASAIAILDGLAKANGLSVDEAKP